MKMKKSKLEHDFGSIVGKENVIVTDKKENEHLVDAPWSSTILSLGFKITPDAIVKPHTTREIVDIVNYAFDKKIPLIPRGGGTSALGESLPIKGGIVIDMKRMNKIVEIEEDKKTLTAGAGVSWRKINTKLKEKRFAVGVNPLNENSTLGGFISKGGYGIGSLKHGSIGNQIVNLEVVLPVGLTINTGYSKSHFSYGFGYNNSWLFTGAEGTLGIITEATLKIYYQNNLKVTVHRVLDEAIFQALSEITRSGNLISLMFLDGELAKTELSTEAERGVLLLLSEERREEPTLEKQKGAISVSEEDFNLWDKLQKFYGPERFGGEVFLPINGLHKIFEVIRKLKENYRLQGLVGFLADSDSIILRLICNEEEIGLKRIALIGDFVRAAINLGGRPYGSGVWNSFWMEEVYDINTLKLMRKIKEQIDSQNIMNPYKTINYPKARIGITTGPPLYQTTTFLEKIFKKIGL